MLKDDNVKLLAFFFKDNRDNRDNSKYEEFNSQYEEFNFQYEEFNFQYEEFNFQYEEFTIGTICNRDNSLNVSKSESITFKELSLFIQRIVSIHSKNCPYLLPKSWSLSNNQRYLLPSIRGGVSRRQAARGWGFWEVLLGGAFGRC